MKSHQYRKRPYVIMNMAMSVDGKVSSIAREPTTFTSREDKRLLVKLRARCDALVTGANTVRIEHATMGVWDSKLRQARVRRGQREHPLRVIISGRLHLDPSLPVFQKQISPLLIVCCESAPKSRRLRLGCLGKLIVCGKHEVDVGRLISILANDYGVQIILCEGGPTVNDAFFRAKAVDELYLTLCSRIVGGKTAPTLAEGIGVAYLKDAVRARLISCHKKKEEWFLKYRFI